MTTNQRIKTSRLKKNSSFETHARVEQSEVTKNELIEMTKTQGYAIGMSDWEINLLINTCSRRKCLWKGYNVLLEYSKLQNDINRFIEKRSSYRDKLMSAIQYPAKIPHYVGKMAEYSLKTWISISRLRLLQWSPRPINVSSGSVVSSVPSNFLFEFNKDIRALLNAIKENGGLNLVRCGANIAHLVVLLSTAAAITVDDYSSLRDSLVSPNDDDNDDQFPKITSADIDSVMSEYSEFMFSIKKAIKVEIACENTVNAFASLSSSRIELLEADKLPLLRIQYSAIAPPPFEGDDNGDRYHTASRCFLDIYYGVFTGSASRDRSEENDKHEAILAALETISGTRTASPQRATGGARSTSWTGQSPTRSRPSSSPSKRGRGNAGSLSPGASRPRPSSSGHTRRDSPSSRLPSAVEMRNTASNDELMTLFRSEESSEGANGNRAKERLFAPVVISSPFARQDAPSAHRELLLEVAVGLLGKDDLMLHVEWVRINVHLSRLVVRGYLQGCSSSTKRVCQIGDEIVSVGGVAVDRERNKELTEIVRKSLKSTRKKQMDGQVVLTLRRYYEGWEVFSQPVGVTSATVSTTIRFKVSSPNRTRKIHQTAPPPLIYEGSDFTELESRVKRLRKEIIKIEKRMKRADPTRLEALKSSFVEKYEEMTQCESIIQEQSRMIEPDLLASYDDPVEAEGADETEKAPSPGTDPFDSLVSELTMTNKPKVSPQEAEEEVEPETHSSSGPAVSYGDDYEEEGNSEEPREEKVNTTETPQAVVVETIEESVSGGTTSSEAPILELRAVETETEKAKAQSRSAEFAAAATAALSRIASQSQGDVSGNAIDSNISSNHDENSDEEDSEVIVFEASMMPDGRIMKPSELILSTCESAVAPLDSPSEDLKLHESDDHEAHDVVVNRSAEQERADAATAALASLQLQMKQPDSDMEREEQGHKSETERTEIADFAASCHSFGAQFDFCPIKEMCDGETQTSLSGNEKVIMATPSTPKPLDVSPTRPKTPVVDSGTQTLLLSPRISAPSRSQGHRYSDPHGRRVQTDSSPVSARKSYRARSPTFEAPMFSSPRISDPSPPLTHRYSDPHSRLLLGDSSPLSGRKSYRARSPTFEAPTFEIGSIGGGRKRTDSNISMHSSRPRGDSNDSHELNKYEWFRRNSRAAPESLKYALRSVEKKYSSKSRNVREAIKIQVWWRLMAPQKKLSRRLCARAICCDIVLDVVVETVARCHLTYRKRYWMMRQGAAIVIQRAFRFFKHSILSQVMKIQRAYKRSVSRAKVMKLVTCTRAAILVARYIYLRRRRLNKLVGKKKLYKSVVRNFLEIIGYRKRDEKYKEINKLAAIKSDARRSTMISRITRNGNDKYIQRFNACVKIQSIFRMAKARMIREDIIREKRVKGQISVWLAMVRLRKKFQARRRKTEAAIVMQRFWRGSMMRWKMMLRVLAGVRIVSTWRRYRQYWKMKQCLRRNESPLTVTFHGLRNIPSRMNKSGSIKIRVSVWWSELLHLVSREEFMTVLQSKRPNVVRTTTLHSCEPQKVAPKIIYAPAPNISLPRKLSNRKISLAQRTKLLLPAEDDSKLDAASALIKFAKLHGTKGAHVKMAGSDLTVEKKPTPEPSAGISRARKSFQMAVKKSMNYGAVLALHSAVKEGDEDKSESSSSSSGSDSGKSKSESDSDEEDDWQDDSPGDEKSLQRVSKAPQAVQERVMFDCVGRDSVNALGQNLLESGSTESRASTIHGFSGVAKNLLNSLTALDGTNIVATMPQRKSLKPVPPKGKEEEELKSKGSVLVSMGTALKAISPKNAPPIVTETGYFTVDLGEEELYVPGCHGNTVLRFDIYDGDELFGTSIFQLSADESLMFWGGEQSKPVSSIKKQDLKAGRATSVIQMQASTERPMLDFNIHAGPPGRSRCGWGYVSFRGTGPIKRRVRTRGFVKSLFESWEHLYLSLDGEAISFFTSRNAHEPLVYLPLKHAKSVHLELAQKGRADKKNAAIEDKFVIVISTTHWDVLHIKFALPSARENWVRAIVQAFDYEKNPLKHIMGSSLSMSSSMERLKSPARGARR